MQQIIDEYGKAIMTVIAILLLIVIIVAVTSGSEGVFQNLISGFYGKATSLTNLGN